MNISDAPSIIGNSGSVSAERSKVIDAINTARPGPVDQSNDGGFGALGQGDFLTLMVAQLQQQDPFEPVDNKEMLAQMAQFSGLAGTNETNVALADIATKLDTLIAAQSQSNLQG